MRSIFSVILIVGSIYTSFANDNKGETKTARFNYDVNPNTLVKVLSSDMDITIQGWDKSEVEVIATLQFKGKETDRAREFIDKFEELVEWKISNNPNELEINTKLDEPNKVQVGSKYIGVQIGYSDDELRINYVVKMPMQNDLYVKNSYEDLIIEGDFTGSTYINHYSGDLDAGTFKDLELRLKYGDANIEAIGRASMELYEQELTVRDLGASEISAKYSNLNFIKSTELDFESYESDIQLDNINKLEGTFKYGEIEITDRCEEMVIDLYELNMEANRIGRAQFKESKYGNLEIRNIGSIRFLESYEDEVEIGVVNEFESNSKYLDLNIERLNDKLELDGYEGEVDVDQISDKATLISVKGKYNDMELSCEDIYFQLDADLKYGNVDYPKDKVERKVMVKDGDQLELQLSPSNGRTANLMIRLRGYETDVIID